MKKSIIFLCVLALAGCQTVLDDVVVPTAEVKVVVFYSTSNSFAPASVRNFSYLELTKSKPVLNSSQNGDFEIIDDAQIELTGNGFEALVRFDPNFESYLVGPDSRYRAGTEYTLNIETPENGTLTSTVTMPDSIQNYTLEIDSIDQEWQVVYNGRLSIPDNTAKDEYFRIEAFSRYFGNDNKMYVENEYFSDENAANGSINARFTTYSWDDEDQERPKVYLILSAITKDHYEYGKALENYDPGNPFSEPSPLPNNIEGGLGIFTLSNSQLVEVK
jgi:hypothetical protein